MPKNPNFKKVVESVKNNSTDYNRHGLFKKVYLKDDFAVIEKDSFETELNRLPLNPAKQQKSISMLKQLGFKTPNIVYYTQSNLSSMLINKIKGNKYYEVQERAKGIELLIRDKDNNLDSQQVKDGFKSILSAPTEHIAEYLNNFFIGYQLGILFDAHGSNIFYDENEGFTFIDLPKIPYKQSLEQYKKAIYEKPYNARMFISAASTRISTYSDIQNLTFLKPYVNLLHNKLFEALSQTNFPINKEQYEELKDYLMPEIGSYGYFSNEEQKLFLNYVESRDISPILEYRTENKKSGFGHKSLPSKYDDLFYIDKTANLEYLNECVNATTLYGVPAREFYNDYKSYIEPDNESDISFENE